MTALHCKMVFYNTSQLLRRFILRSPPVQPSHSSCACVLDRQPSTNKIQFILNSTRINIPRNRIPRIEMATHEHTQYVSKKSRKSISLEHKLIVIRRMEAGETRASVSRSLNLAPATITTIMANAEKIKESAQKTTKHRAAYLTYSRSATMEKMEQMLVSWIENVKSRDVPLKFKDIADMAKKMFHDIQKIEGGNETFFASKGWYVRFKQRSQLRNEESCEETEIAEQSTCIADLEATQSFPIFFKTIIEEGKFPPDLVFNVDETGLYWKKMLSRTYMTNEEKSTPEPKADKDRITLLLCSNTSGTLKLKPLLIHYSENPRAIKGFIKSHLPVIWKSNKRSCVTQQIFIDWYSSEFCPKVLHFCVENNFPQKAVLVLDEAPGHPPNLEEIRSDLDVKVVYLPNNISSDIQPMTQGITASFKAFYLREIFLDLLRQINTLGVSLTQFWKDYDVLKSVNNISAAWIAVTRSCIQNGWCKIWCDCKTEDTNILDVVIQEISRLAQEAGLDNIDAGGIQSLLESHEEPLSNKTFEEIQKDPEETEEETGIKPMKTKDLQSILADIDKAVEQLCDIDPDWERSSSVKKGINMMLHPYLDIIKERKKKSKQPLIFTAEAVYIKEEPIDICESSSSNC